MGSVSLPWKNDVNRGSSVTGCGNKSPEDHGAAGDDGVTCARLKDLGKDIHRLWVANKILKEKMLQELQTSSDDMDELIEDMKREKALVLREHGLSEYEMRASGIDDDVEESLWWQRFQEAENFQKRHGHVHVHCKNEHRTLGGWLSKQRGLQREGKLSAARQQKLEQLGLEWDGEKAKRLRREIEGAPPEAMRLAKKTKTNGGAASTPTTTADRESKWEERFALLELFAREFGHASPAQKNLPPKFHALGHWSTNIRVEFRAGRLPREKKEALQKLGFVFDAKVAQHIRESNGCSGCNTTSRMKHGSSQTKRIEQIQRQALKKDDELDADDESEEEQEVRELDQTQSSGMAGTGTKIEAKDGPENQEEDQQMVSTPPLPKSVGKEAKKDAEGETATREKFDEKFKTNLAVLKEYRRLHGHACPAQKESKLGRWLSDMREKYRHQELAAGKIAALEAIGVVFNGSEARKLRASIEMNIAKAGPAQPSVSHESVSQSVSHSLPTLRFKNASEKDEWSKMFDSLLRYKAEQGHLCVPVRDPSGLGRWCSNQRSMHKEEKLSLERYRLLKDVGFEFNGHIAMQQRISHGAAALQAENLTVTPLKPSTTAIATEENDSLSSAASSSHSVALSSSSTVAPSSSPLVLDGTKSKLFQVESEDDDTRDKGQKRREKPTLPFKEKDFVSLSTVVKTSQCKMCTKKSSVMCAICQAPNPRCVSCPDLVYCCGVWKELRSALRAVGAEKSLPTLIQQGVTLQALATLIHVMPMELEKVDADLGLPLGSSSLLRNILPSSPPSPDA